MRAQLDEVLLIARSRPSRTAIFVRGACTSQGHRLKPSARHIPCVYTQRSRLYDMAMKLNETHTQNFEIAKLNCTFFMAGLLALLLSPTLDTIETTRQRIV